MTKKLIRITTVPMALRYLLPGQPAFMQKNGFDVLLISNDGPELEAVKQAEQCRHIMVPLTRKITPWQDLRCLYKLYKIFRKEKPDIVHTHTPKAGLIGMLAAKFAGVKCRIHTVAGLPLTASVGMKKRILVFTEKITYWAANHVWPNSNSIFNIIRNMKLCPESKMEVIGQGSTNGVDVARFNREAISESALQEIKQQIGYDPGLTYLLFIGRLVKDKGLVELIRVFQKLLLNYPNLRLVMVGKYEPELDPLPEQSLALIEQTPEIIHIPWTEKVEQYMALANLFVFPSHREGFPNVVLQAGAMQLPIICSIIEGNIDIVLSGKTGMLFGKANEEELQLQLEWALNNSSQMQVMAAALHQKVINDYARERIWQLLLDKYRMLT